MKSQYERTGKISNQSQPTCPSKEEIENYQHSKSKAERNRRWIKKVKDMERVSGDRKYLTSHLGKRVFRAGISGLWQVSRPIWETKLRSWSFLTVISHACKAHMKTLWLHETVTWTEAKRKNKNSPKSKHLWPMSCTGHWSVITTGQKLLHLAYCT